MKCGTLKILILLFFLNNVSLLIYFTSKPTHAPRADSSAPRAGKPWPALPSYLPWSPNSHVKFRSCEAYFGNGFTRRVDVLTPRAGGGYFKCFYSETLRSSVCEGGRVRMHPDGIRMSRGGETIQSVIGRGEDEELPVFELGAFDVDVGDDSDVGAKLASKEFLDRYVQRGEVSRHTMRHLIDSIQLVRSTDFECAEWVEEPTLLVTRFEYANLFHTVTDWYSAYVASRITGLANRPGLVFVDGHCMSPLEETWKAMFSSLRYAKNFSGPVCFRRAILSPLGYETAIFKGLTENIDCYGASASELLRNPNDHKTARLSELGEMIRASFGFPVDGNRVKTPVSGHNVLFVRREDYLAHPRHGGKIQSRLSNEQEVFDALQEWAKSHVECEVNIINGLFAHMPLKEQVEAIQEASVIVGAHGAGLTHIVSASPETVILEIVSSEYRRPHFQLISQWKSLQYHAIYLQGSHANPQAVISELGGILTSLGC